MESKIEWTDFTWNPWQGCSKVSDGCKFCYMFRDMARWQKDGGTVVRSSAATFNMPLRIKMPGRVFTCSWSDFFHSGADNWRDDAWGIIRRTPHLTYQILTKRPERIKGRLPRDWGDGYRNVWLGISLENDEFICKRYTELANVSARVKFVSFEPLLGEITILPCGVDWAIIGGESGNDAGAYRYRETKLEWIEELIADMQAQRTKVFVKQLGTHLSKKLNLKERHGRDMSEWPEHLRVREFPEIKNPDKLPGYR